MAAATAFAGRLSEAGTRTRRARLLSAAVLPLLAGVTCAVLIAVMAAGGRGSPHQSGGATASPAMLRCTLAGVRSPVSAMALPPARGVLLRLAWMAAAQPPVPKPGHADVSYTRNLVWDGDLGVTSHGPVARLAAGSVQTWTALGGAS
jgi:hypothetical protein